MPALVAGIHGFLAGLSASTTWMAGTSPDKPGRDSGANGNTLQRIEAHLMNDSGAVAVHIADAAAESGISLVASLPDGWITPLIMQFAVDSRFRHVPVNREE